MYNQREICRLFGRIREYARNTTKELKSPVLRFMQVEECLKRHLSKISKTAKYLSDQRACQQSVHWTLGILRLFRAFFLASSFSCSYAESTPAHTPLTQTVIKNQKRYIGNRHGTIESEE
jgi:hypothetical protein